MAEHRPDVAILDVKMPGLDGIEAARRIAPQRGTAVVILTAFSQRELIEQAREAGAMTYLVKPYRRDALVPRWSWPWPGSRRWKHSKAGSATSRTGWRCASS